MKSIFYNRVRITLSLFLSLMLGYCLPGCSGNSANPEPVVLSGETMGTRFNVQINPDTSLSEDEINSVADGIDELLAEINRQMSVWDDNSEITSFNNSRDTGWFAVSIPTSRVIANTLEVSEMTGGALDVTVAPLVDLWGFGPGSTEERIPTEPEIESALAIIGYRRLAVRNSPPTLKKELPELRCDLGAVAKGYGVDVIADLVRAHGCDNYLVEIGGEISARGVSGEGVPWQVGIQKPETDFGTVGAVSLDNMCLATSGDYQSYFEKDGRRYSHLIDPRTGYPITHTLASVTVIYRTCLRADALATALNVMGFEEGYDLAIQSGIAAQFIIREGDSFAVRSTPEFEKYLQTEK